MTRELGDDLGKTCGDRVDEIFQVIAHSGPGVDNIDRPYAGVICVHDRTICCRNAILAFDRCAVHVGR